MSMDTSQLAFPKAEPRKRTKARKDRVAAKVVKSVRAQCVDRDGRCRLLQILKAGLSGDTWAPSTLDDPCNGPSELAHMHVTRRSQTRNQAPEIRHTTKDSLMACRFHHQQYDAHRLRITALSRKGADGPLKFTRAK